MQHIEEAGIHSGDSACVIPPHSLPGHVIEEIKRQTRQLALELGVAGLMNVQFADSEQVRSRRIGRLRSRSQSARQPNRAVRFQGHRHAAGAHGLAGHGRQDARRTGAVRGSRADAFLRQGKRLPVQQIPGRGHHSRARDAFDRRSHGHRRSLSDGVRQEPDGGHPPRCRNRARSYISVADRDKPEVVPIARGFAEMGYAICPRAAPRRFCASKASRSKK